MNLNLNFEDISDEELKILVDRYVNIRIHFAERLNLVRLGETNIKKKVLLIIEDVKRTRDNCEATSFDLLNGLLDDLRKLVNE